MEQVLQNVLHLYISELKKIYGSYMRQIILYGSYARGDYTIDSDIDIMILLDLTDLEIKRYRHQLSNITFDFNMDYDLDIKPIAKSEEQYKKWVKNYPFYANVNREGVTLYESA
ncbi:MAG: nucleotidyltransferase domain-containing protein [Lachnospiraceae bacterium]